MIIAILLIGGISASNSISLKCVLRDDRNMANIKTQHHQIVTTITNRFLKMKPMVKVPVMANNAFFTAITFSKIGFFT